MENQNLRAQLHTLIGNEMRLAKRSEMSGHIPFHIEAHKKAKEELKQFLEKNPSMMEHVETVEDHFLKKLNS